LDSTYETFHRTDAGYASIGVPAFFLEGQNTPRASRSMKITDWSGGLLADVPQQRLRSQKQGKG